MELKTAVLNAIPLIGTIILVVLVILNPSGSDFTLGSILQLYFGQIVAIFLLWLNTILTRLELRQSPLEGTWKVKMTVEKWKGDPNEIALGSGTMKLVRNGDRTCAEGFMKLEYTNRIKASLFKAIYEVRFEIKSDRKIDASSLMLFRDPKDERPQDSWVRECQYDLQIDKKHLTMKGSAKVESHESEGRFVATKVN